MPDSADLQEWLSLLHGERRLLAAFLHQADPSLGLPRAYGLELVQGDENRLQHLIAKGLLDSRGEQLFLPVLLAQMLKTWWQGDPSLGDKPVEGLLPLLTDALQGQAAGERIRHLLARIHEDGYQDWPEETLASAITLMQDEALWAQAWTDSRTRQQHRLALEGLFQQAEANQRTAQESPTAWQSPFRQHLHWLEELRRQDQLITHSNLSDILTQEHSLWLDGKESYSTRPSLSAVLVEGFHPVQKMPQPLSRAEGASHISWHQYRDAFADSDMDLLSFLQRQIEEPETIMALFIQAAIQDQPQLLHVDNTQTWAGRQWIEIRWRPTGEAQG